MPKVKRPTYFKSADENTNRRQESEDRFFDELLMGPREFLADGVGITITATGGKTETLQHGLGFPVHGWLLTRVQLAAGAVSGPSLPFYRAGDVDDGTNLELYFEDAGTYTFLVY